MGFFLEYIVQPLQKVFICKRKTGHVPAAATLTADWAAVLLKVRDASLL